MTRRATKPRNPIAIALQHEKRIAYEPKGWQALTPADCEALALAWLRGEIGVSAINAAIHEGSPRRGGAVRAYKAIAEGARGAFAAGRLTVPKPRRRR